MSPSPSSAASDGVVPSSYAAVASRPRARLVAAFLIRAFIADPPYRSGDTHPSPRHKEGAEGLAVQAGKALWGLQGVGHDLAKPLKTPRRR